MGASAIDSIKQRYSVRSYDTRPIEPSVRDQITGFLRTNTSGPLGSKVRFELVEVSLNNPEQLKEFGTYGMIRGAHVFIAGAVVRNSKAMEDFGYCMEQNILMATGLGLGTCWLGGTLKRSTFAARMNCAADELIPAVTPLGYALDKRPLRDSIIRLAVGARSRKPFPQLFFDTTTDRPLSGSPEDPIVLALECVRCGPSASNKQPWRIIRSADKGSFHFYIKPDPSYEARFKEIRIQYVDMGIAMCHFEAALKDQGIAGKWNTSEMPVVMGDFKYVTSFTLDK
jgi:nitroreductase